MFFVRKHYAAHRPAHMFKNTKTPQNPDVGHKEFLPLLPEHLLSILVFTALR